MAIRVISSDERQSRRLQMSVAQRVTRHSRSAARRTLRHVPGTARRYAISLGARNAARVTFDTGCYSFGGYRHASTHHQVTIPSFGLPGIRTIMSA